MEEKAKLAGCYGDSVIQGDEGNKSHALHHKQTFQLDLQLESFQSFQSPASSTQTMHHFFGSVSIYVSLQHFVDLGLMK